MSRVGWSQNLAGFPPRILLPCGQHLRHRRSLACLWACPTAGALEPGGHHVGTVVICRPGALLVARVK